MAEFTVDDKEQLLRIVKFIGHNPENKRRQISCPTHGEETLIIIDDGPDRPIKVSGCCQAAVDELHKQIAWATMLYESQHPE